MITSTYAMPPSLPPSITLVWDIYKLVFSFCQFVWSQVFEIAELG